VTAAHSRLTPGKPAVGGERVGARPSVREAGASPRLATIRVTAFYKQNGQALKALEAGLEMTRFGVMKHLHVLERAGVVTTQKRGREKLHFLNPVPIRLIHDRWVRKYAEPSAATFTGSRRHWRATAFARQAREAECGRAQAGFWTCSGGRVLESGSVPR
jgi:DNA-binding transcriptional ArsR family regulator